MAKNKFINLFIALSVLFFSNTLFANNFFTKNQQNKFVYDFTNTITSYEAAKLENNFKKIKELTNSNIYLVVLNNNQNLDTDNFIMGVMDDMKNSSNLNQKFIVLFLIKNKNEMLMTFDGKADLTIDQDIFLNNLHIIFNGEAKNNLENGKYLEAINLCISNIKLYLKGYKYSQAIQKSEKDFSHGESLKNENRSLLDKQELVDMPSAANLRDECYFIDCDKPKIKKIKVSDVSIKEFRLRMSEEDLLKINPKFKKMPRTSNLTASENIYECNSGVDVNLFDDPKFDICGVSVGTHHPSNVILAFRENKLSEINMYFTNKSLSKNQRGILSLKGLSSPHDIKRNDLVYTLTSKFGNTSYPTMKQLEDHKNDGYYHDKERQWILGDNQVKIKITASLYAYDHNISFDYFQIYIEDREMLDAYQAREDELRNQSKKSNLKDLINRKSKDI